MKFNELNLEPNKKVKRVGRGIAAGGGKTAGRGTKGQGARTGKKKRSIFQGGSRSLVTAVPKARGFKSHRKQAQVVYLDTLNEFKDKEVDNLFLFEQGYIKTPYEKVKVITRGKLTVPLTLKVQACSKSSEEAIKKAGGNFLKTELPKQPKTRKEA